MVLGGRGLVGSAVIRDLKSNGYENILSPNSGELNLLEQKDTRDFFEKHKPNHVILAAAKVGGIHANNTYRADFIFQNLQMETNVFEASFKNDVEKLLFLGSSCIYPKNAPQPIREDSLLTSPLEPTNEPYAIAKIAGVKMAESFRRQYGKNYFCLMPTNLYGEGDNYDLENSHVIPGLIARMQKAIDENQNEFKIWGSGKPKREFLYVDDLAAACRYVLEFDGDVPDLMNVGYGKDIEIGELAKMIKELMGFKGELNFDSSKPDGTMRKIIDSSQIRELGWEPKISLEKGLELAINYYRNEYKR